jgi:hypothetical protein
MMHGKSDMEARSLDQTPAPAPDDGRNVLIDLATPRVAVAVFTEGSPSDEEWVEYIETLRRLGDASHRTLVFSAGGGPTALQREDLERLTEEQEHVKVAVITRSLVARGMVTALRWLRRDANAAFEPGKLDAAFDYLGLDDPERHRARELAVRLAERLGLADEFGL